MSLHNQCPICQKFNACQAQNSEKTCWCTEYRFPEKLNEMITTLPLQCICSTCAQALGALKNKKVIHKND